MKKAISIIAKTYRNMIKPEQCVVGDCCKAACMDMKELQIILEKDFNIKVDIRWYFSENAIECELRDEKLKEYICKSMKGSIVSDKIEDGLLDKEWGKNTGENEDDKVEVLYDCFFMKVVNCRKDIIVSTRRARENTMLFCEGYSHIFLDEIYGRYKAFLDALYDDIDGESAKKKFKLLLNSICQLDTSLRKIWNDRKNFVGELLRWEADYNRVGKDGDWGKCYIVANIIYERAVTLNDKICEEEIDYLNMLNMGIKLKVGMLIEHILIFGNYFEIESADGLRFLNDFRKRFPDDLMKDYLEIGSFLEDVMENNMDINKLRKYCEELESRIGNRNKFYLVKA